MLSFLHIGVQILGSQIKRQIHWIEIQLACLSKCWEVKRNCQVFSMIKTHNKNLFWKQNSSLTFYERKVGKRRHKQILFDDKNCEQASRWKCNQSNISKADVVLRQKET